MEFFRKIFGISNIVSSEDTKPKIEDESDEVFLRGTGNFDLEIVGESFYQDNLEVICGPRNERGENREAVASLILEDENKFDKNNAVRVEIEGKQVGYLSKKVARAYRITMKENGHLHSIVTCNANIRGGWQRKNGNIGSYGVWLDIPFEEE